MILNYRFVCRNPLKKIFILFSFLILIFYIGLYFIKINAWKEIDNLPNLDSNISFYIEFVEKNHNYNKIRGWCVKRGENSRGAVIKAILWNKSLHKGQIFSVNQQIRRHDVTKHFNDGFNYDNSGFAFSIKSESSPINNKESELYLQVEIGGRIIAVNTGLLI